MELEPQMGLTFEQVWATIQRIAEKHEELAEQHKKTEQAVDKMIKESAEQRKEFAEQRREFAEQCRESAEQRKEFAEQRRESAEQSREMKQAIKELAEQHKETEAVIKRISEKHEELAEQHKKTEEAINKMSRELNKAVGELGNKFGELVEHLVSPSLQEKFNALGYTFEETNTRIKCKDQNSGQTIAEIDVLLENKKYVLAVEIKSFPSIEDVKDHLTRMEILRSYADLQNDKRDYIGAIAGAVVSESVRNFAFKKGFYVLEQSGDTMNICTPSETWEPEKWKAQEKAHQ